MADLADPHQRIPFLSLDLESEADTVRLAVDLSVIVARGDLVCLSGDLGAGKSTLARALIRAFAGDSELEVPSPTFTLVQTYGFERFDLSHFDLYRLEEPEEIEELGLDDLLETGAALVEWPEQAGGLLPDGALWLRLTETGGGAGRRICFHSEDPAWEPRIRSTLAVRTFLGKAGCPEAPRRFLAGDASLRSFEAVTTADGPAVLMKWPFRDDGSVPSAVSDYMETVHLARDCRSVLAIGGELRRRGFAAAEVLHADPQAGLVLMQDLGRQTIVADGEPVPERYQAAVEVLAALHGQDWPDRVPLADSGVYQVPAYTQEALLAEANLFLDWYVPHVTGAPADAAARHDFESVWRAALTRVAGSQQGWVLRDFHSPNLLWRPGEEGLARIGLIDFQDTVTGLVGYDVGSLLFDARTLVTPELETGLLRSYVDLRHEQPAAFDERAFLEAYAVMAAQRITKILGIFVRLARRDGKPAYLDHLPRMNSYLDRVLTYPVLSDVKDMFARFRQ